MVSHMPASLKSTDINRFILRAAQLEKLRPPIAYWCYYWAVNQILSKSLHMQDDECKNYTTELMDKLEQIKEDNPTDDAILDDLTGQAYVEQFATETFQRADNAVRANKASKQTADTFQAAAAFFEATQIWGSVSPETTAKVKFAKYHALRIAKALKSGQDPNLSNPVVESDQRQEEAPLDANDPEVQAIEQAGRQPSVEDVPDESTEVYSNMTGRLSSGDVSHSPRVSPLPGPSISQDEQAKGSYFPEAPYGHGDAQPALIDSDVGRVTPPSITYSPPKSMPPPSDSAPIDSAREFYTQNPISSFGPPSSKSQVKETTEPAQILIPIASQTHNAAAVSSTTNQNYNMDDMAVIDAQKHAKWAISALNFEDVPTAVKELREALRALNAL